MEKFIIKTYQNYMTEEQKKFYDDEMFRIAGKNHDIPGAKKFSDDFIEAHCAVVTKEYPATLFENMKTQEDLFNFIENEIQTEDLINWEFINVPDYLKQLEPWIPRYAQGKEKFLNNVKENPLSYFSNWRCANRELPKETAEILANPEEYGF